MRIQLLLASLIVIACAATSPVHAEDAKAEAGAEVYENYCATCHGEQLQNNTGASFDLRRLRPDEHERFVGSVTNGKKAMPSWKGVLDAEQIEALWAYIRANAYE
jgi:mono/diheme cytochrome c family protein